VRTRVWITNEARLRLLSHVLMLVLTQLVCGRPNTHIEVKYMQSTWFWQKLYFLTYKHVKQCLQKPKGNCTTNDKVEIHAREGAISILICTDNVCLGSVSVQTWFEWNARVWTFWAKHNLQVTFTHLQWTLQHHFPANSTLHSHRHINITSHLVILFMLVVVAYLHWG
jgi:hypothetical protein